MRIPDFVHHRPATLAEACELAASLGEEARFLAGGTELVTDLKKGRVRVRHLVSLSAIEGLGEIRRDAAWLKVGARARLEKVARSPLVLETFPALSEAAAAIGCVQIREQGTIGGNFAGAVPCADTPPACIAGRARVRLLRADGERTLTAEELFLGPRETAMERGELIGEILVPVPPPGGGAAFRRFALRKGMAVAVASVAAGLWLEDGVVKEARIALGAVAPVPYLAADSGASLAGREPTAQAFDEAAALAAREAAPICDVRGSDEHRRQVVRVLARRALDGALSRAREARP